MFGLSLGSALAVDLSARAEEGAVILEGAPASLAALNARQYPLFPMRLLMRNRFDSISKVGQIRAPTLFLHAIDDQVVPISEARRLFEAARSEKRFVELRGGHAGIIAAEASAFTDAIREFLRAHDVVR